MKTYCSSTVGGELKVWDLGNRLLDRVILNKTPKVIFFNGSKGDVVVGQGNYLLRVSKDTWLPPGGLDALEKANKHLAILKLQARFRGSSIRRVLGTGIHSKVLNHTRGDDGEGVSVSEDGTLRKKKTEEAKYREDGGVLAGEGIGLEQEMKELLESGGNAMKGEGGGEGGAFFGRRRGNEGKPAQFFGGRRGT